MKRRPGGHAWRAIPAFFRFGIQQAIAYRAEMLVWIFSTTMPFVMLLLWEAVAQDGAIGRLGPAQFRIYFLATYCVRQICGSWVSWQINAEMRDGSFSLRLLRPVHPIFMLGVEQVSTTLFRILIAVPVALAGFVFLSYGTLHLSAVGALLFALSLVGGWLLTFYVNVVAGLFAFYTDQSTKLMDLWTTMFFAFSGYLIPTELFPVSVRSLVSWLPFRYQLGFPVELMTGLTSPEHALVPLAVQWSYVAGFVAVAHLLFRRGVVRFGAQGG